MLFCNSNPVCWEDSKGHDFISLSDDTMESAGTESPPAGLANNSHHIAVCMSWSADVVACLRVLCCYGQWDVTSVTSCPHIFLCQTLVSGLWIGGLFPTLLIVDFPTAEPFFCSHNRCISGLENLPRLPHGSGKVYPWERGRALHQPAEAKANVSWYPSSWRSSKKRAFLLWSDSQPVVCM